MLTKISSALKHPKPLDRSTAWGCLISNLVVLPGLGSLTAGRRVGCVQAPISIAGLVLLNFWLFCFGRVWFREGRFPADGGPHFGLGVLGFGVLVIVWAWALVTSISILRQARVSPAPPVSHEAAHS
ncbi:MAG: hypothetical protein HY360_09305 [Verrucomicrobia bacterium]|nr:hypothetical protein [Verrucomicrobiota bacterium]